MSIREKGRNRKSGVGKVTSYRGRLQEAWSLKNGQAVTEARWRKVLFNAINSSLGFALEKD
jgi:hypothetical protein